MQSEDLIPAGDFCTYHHVELSFIRHLHESGLIGMTFLEGSAYLSAGELPNLEKFARWFYDLDINPQGIEALSHVLDKMHRVLEENRVLRNRLQRYENNSAAEPEDIF
jgi:chaperone modulatory protein CbpM